MTVVRWNPIAEMEDVLNRAFAAPLSNAARDGKAFTPRVDILERADAYEVALDLPGVAADAGAVEWRDGVLRVSGERADRDDADDERVHRRERATGRFARAFALPEDADPESIRATSAQGVLTIRVGKRAEVMPRSIEIEVH